MISISLDGGKNWVKCPEGVRVNIAEQDINGEDSKGDLVFNFTHEGVITDIWAQNDLNYGSNVGTSSELYCDIIERLVEDNS